MPDLRLPERSRRPVRQLRQPARPDGSDRSAVEDRRHASRVREHEAPVPRPARVQGSAHGVDRWSGQLAAERQAVLAELRPGAQAAADHARSRLGRPDTRSRLRGIRRQADLRLVRRGDRIPLRVDRVGRESRDARRMARVVAEPGSRAHVLHGEGQHRLPHGHLAEHAPRLRVGRRHTAPAAAISTSPTTSRRASS